MESNDPVSQATSQIDQILGGGAEQSSSDPSLQATSQIDQILGGQDQSGTSPSVADAKSKVGNQDDNGMCQRFAEEVAYGKTGIFPSAADAWNSYVQNGQAVSGDVSKAPAGALIYFAPDASNGDFGHVGVADGEGNIISATYNGVEESNINDWIKNTGQTPLGYAKP